MAQDPLHLYSNPVFRCYSHAFGQPLLYSELVSSFVKIRLLRVCLHKFVVKIQGDDTCKVFSTVTGMNKLLVRVGQNYSDIYINTITSWLSKSHCAIALDVLLKDGWAGHLPVYSQIALFSPPPPPGHTLLSITFPRLPCSWSLNRFGQWGTPVDDWWAGRGASLGHLSLYYKSSCQSSRVIPAPSLFLSSSTSGHSGFL